MMKIDGTKKETFYKNDGHSSQKLCEEFWKGTVLKYLYNMIF